MKASTAKRNGTECLAIGSHRATISAIFEQFVQASPINVMLRAIMERIFSADKLDELFEDTAEKQYTRELLFSSVVGLMSLVVSGIHPSVNAAYKALEKQIGMSKPALSGKLNGLEPRISQVLRYSHRELAPLITTLAPTQTVQLPGYPIRIADGNHLGATEHRLKPLQATRSGPLLGQSIAVLDPAQLLVSDVFLCEDAHAQERAVLQKNA
jgi:hypothetical protein